MGVRELRPYLHHYYKKMSCCAGEYWCYGVIPSIIISFFERKKDDFDILKHNYADLIFKEYFRRLNESHSWYDINVMDTPLGLYIHHENENSVTESRTNTKSLCDQIKDNCILQAMYLEKCKAAREVFKKLVATDAKVVIKAMYPRMEKIQKVLMSVYDNCELPCDGF